MNSNQNIKRNGKGRNLWPTAIIAYFVVFIAFVIGFSIFATRQKMDLVAHDYYDQEIKFQQQVDRVNKTQPVKAEVVIEYEAAQGVIRLSPPPSQRSCLGFVHLYRPSDETLDKKVTLQLASDGFQRIPTTSLEPGLWKVRVQWTNSATEYFCEKSVIIAGS